MASLRAESCSELCSSTTDERLIVLEKRKRNFDSHYMYGCMHVHKHMYTCAYLDICMHVWMDVYMHI